jgi:hypothetical protein
MNYYQPRQREGSKRWDYTCKNDGRIWPVGYCVGYERAKLTPQGAETIGLRFYGGKDGESAEEVCARWNAEHIDPLREKYHDDGHATEEEARLCHRNYELDTHLKFFLDRDDADEMHRCEAPSGCKEFTSGLAAITGGGGSQWHLCISHRNRETVEQLYQPHDSISSY